MPLDIDKYMKKLTIITHSCRVNNLIEIKKYKFGIYR